MHGTTISQLRSMDDNEQVHNIQNINMQQMNQQIPQQMNQQIPQQMQQQMPSQQRIHIQHPNIRDLAEDINHNLNNNLNNNYMNVPMDNIMAPSISENIKETSYINTFFNKIPVEYRAPILVGLSHFIISRPFIRNPININLLKILKTNNPMVITLFYSVLISILFIMLNKLVK